MEYLLLIIPALILISIAHDIYLKVCKVNFCTTCKHLKEEKFCTHENFKKYNYVKSESYSPLAENVRRSENPHCTYWEEK